MRGWWRQCAGLLLLVVSLAGLINYCIDFYEISHQQERRICSSHDNKRLFLRVESEMGRLGNHMYLYASLLGVALANNRTPIWGDSNSILPTVFNIRIPIDKGNVIAKSPDSKFVTVAAGNWIYNNQTERLPECNVTLSGYMQSRLYFIKAEHELRKHFAFLNATLKSAESFIEKVLPASCKRDSCTMVAVHVRRGDMNSNAHIANGWTQVGKDYFRRAMDYFSSLYGSVVFVVLSDDIPWCRQNVKGNQVVYSEGLSIGEDLAVASLCDHAIITLGTFGLWVAWFADGITVRPVDMPRNNSVTYKQLKDATHYFPMNSVLL